MSRFGLRTIIGIYRRSRIGQDMVEAPGQYLYILLVSCPQLSLSLLLSSQQINSIQYTLPDLSPYHKQSTKQFTLSEKKKVVEIVQYNNNIILFIIIVRDSIAVIIYSYKKSLALYTRAPKTYKIFNYKIIKDMPILILIN